MISCKAPRDPVQRLLRALILAVLVAVAPAAYAQAWTPSKPVEFIVPAGPGGALDQAARLMKQVFDARGNLGQSFVVSNRPGGVGKPAFNALAQREGDPHLLAYTTHGYLSNFIGGTLDVLPHRDFTPVVLLLDESIVVAVRAGDERFKTAQDLVTHLRAKPDGASIAVAASVGNHIHVGIAKPLRAAGVDIGKLTVIAFRSSGDSLTALLGGHVDVVAATTPNVMTLHQAGKIRLIAVSSAARLGGGLSAVPTWREQGVDSVFHSSLGVLAAKGISRAQIAFWERAYRELSESEEWKRQVERNQSFPHFLGHEDTVRFYDEETRSMRTLLTAMGLARQ
ncbi:MAG: tripartite tricarboxylate transporter substrate binding protein [Burkholderiales bacterium]|nr:tripartite tricarboxylate transporter substrate binding protein [Burkholderiales bacterium]